ncbi:MAG TPA: DegQ family serine endoprotease [Gammaproteobacteria bacterium]
MCSIVIRRVLPIALLVLAAPASAAVEAMPLQTLPDFVSLAEQVSPTVVNISTTQRLEVAATDPAEALPERHPFEDLFEQFSEPAPQPPELFDSSSLGSGVIISADGEILTNYHVIRGAEEIVVRLADRRQMNATLIGADAASDLALLKIDATGLPVAHIGDARELRVGEWVMAIGSPFGFDYSVTSGIVSAKGRSVGTERYVPYIQTDVAINPGNSGGPLFNMNGEVVGINSQIYSRTGGFMGVSFAIPVNLAMDVAAQLRTNGRVSRGWLGVDIQDVTRELAESFQMARPEGALVRNVFEKSPADEAGLEVGDIILAFNGQAVYAADELPPMVGGVPAGSEVVLSVMREGERRELGVTLGEVPVETLPAVAESREGGDGRLGLTVRELRFSERETLAVEEGGVIVEEVAPGPARQAGLRIGDVILSVDRKPILDEDDFRAAVDALPHDRHVAVLVQRGGTTVFVPLRVAE